MALVAAAAALLAPLPAAAQSAMNIGVLSCEVAPAVGLVVGSTQPVRCVFRANNSRRREVYHGAISRVGLDVGITEGSRLTWSVWAPTRRIQRHGLVGRYTGTSSALAIGAGAGSSTELLGGPARGIALQPLALQNVVGVNVALGITGLTLE
ncbi:DUF992 domain-containing protein [Rhodovulum sp. PH10]|uniref:DUF992 domain-containing protein n=1 Tax=Rhodovulum sp. PH10 TaxID=1187851 RepID=UPI001ED8EE1D|nr:DUF992 domain-containing protein [Rhodovulum sp. PH10]